MQSISESIHIEAPVEEVWEILSDLDSWREWNPFIREADGVVAEGERLRLKMFPAEGRPMTFTPKVLSATPREELRWLGRLGFPGVFDGEHAFHLSAQDGGTLVTQVEEFRGVLVPLLKKMLQNTRDDFRRLNEALKERAETRAG
ncbi:SRPBCC family protein [Salininema proteolyticum]|uniref:SRPBCC family protein n=1 Tax=Salininema proteolyticum TaxID=1607685 RepID=A0ABV8TVD4_9ACTN